MTTTQPAALPESATVLPDGSAFAIASFPLPADHWLYAPREYRDGEDDPIELPAPILNHRDHGDAVRAAIRYAVRSATMCGKEEDFDPDALVQNAMYALCGPFGAAALQSQPAAEGVSDWALRSRTQDLLHLLSLAKIETPTPGDKPEAEKAMADIRAILATRPLVASDEDFADKFDGWIETIKAAHDESLEDLHKSSRAMLRDLIEEMEAARAILALRPQSESDEPTDEQIAAGMRELFAGPKPWPSWETTLKRVYQAMSALRPQAVPMTDEHLARAKLAGVMAGNAVTRDHIHAYIDEARALLDETYQFAATSPRSQENINGALAMLDDIAAAAETLVDHHGITAQGAQGGEG